MKRENQLSVEWFSSKRCPLPIDWRFFSIRLIWSKRKEMRVFTEVDRLLSYSKFSVQSYPNEFPVVVSSFWTWQGSREVFGTCQRHKERWRSAVGSRSPKNSSNVSNDNTGKFQSTSQSILKAQLSLTSTFKWITLLDEFCLFGWLFSSHRAKRRSKSAEFSHETANSENNFVTEKEYS